MFVQNNQNKRNLKFRISMMKLDEILINSRICPQPMIWNKIWEQIQLESKEKIFSPLILAAWHFTSDEEKKERFVSHLQKAEESGVLENVLSMLESSEDLCYHK